MKDPLNNYTMLRHNYPPVGNKLQVEFTSDNSLTGNGFQLVFEDSKLCTYFDFAFLALSFQNIVVSECGGEITLDSNGGERRIKSPNYYYRTPPFMTCIWTINIPDGQTLAVSLDSFYVSSVHIIREHN